MARSKPSAKYDRRLFAVGDVIASGPLRTVDRPRAMRFAYLSGALGLCGLAFSQVSQIAEWVCLAAAASAVARVAHLLLDKSTWVERPAPELAQISSDISAER
jgi:hypothetical protein